MMKQIYKQILTMLALVLPILAGVLPGTDIGVRAQSIVTEIVTDPLTGIAIGGMDPVSYFTEPAPLPGSSTNEFYWKGVPWHFATAANLEIFKRAPEIYAPQYGGHGAMSMARGFVSDSDPHIYAVFKQRLYLFYSAGNREAFALAPDEAALKGEQQWQTLSKTLSSQ
jgi:hypothetical protein